MPILGISFRGFVSPDANLVRMQPRDHGSVLRVGKCSQSAAAPCGLRAIDIQCAATGVRNAAHSPRHSGPQVHTSTPHCTHCSRASYGTQKYRGCSFSRAPKKKQCFPNCSEGYNTIFYTTLLVFVISRLIYFRCCRRRDFQPFAPDGAGRALRVRRAHAGRGERGADRRLRERRWAHVSAVGAQGSGCAPARSGGRWVHVGEHPAFAAGAGSARTSVRDRHRPRHGRFRAHRAQRDPWRFSRE